MKSARLLAFVGIVLLPPVSSAQSAFEGTWRPDPQKPGPAHKPDVLKLSGGIYDCQTCTPPYKIKADDMDQPVAGNPYYDTVSISIMDARTVLKIGKKAGKTVFRSTIVVSNDGGTYTESQTLFDMAPTPIAMTSRSSRVAAGSKGSHPLSGGWQLIETDLTNHDEDTTYKINGDTLTMSDRMGRSFVASLDGTDAPYQGDPQFTSVSVKMLGAATLQESDKKAGKVVQINQWSIDPDGRTMHARFDNTQGKVQEQTGHKIQ